MDLLEFAENYLEELKNRPNYKEDAPEEKKIQIKISEPEKPKVECFACSSKSLWRKKGSSTQHWICGTCHPPAISKNEIVWRSNS